MDKSWGEFADWMKGQEQWRPEVYDDIGHPAVGWGHRLRPGESFDGPIDEETGNELYYNDLVRAMEHARSATKRFGANYDELPVSAQQKLAERAFNVGGQFANKFPRWTEAVISGDTDTELSEHHRHYRDPKTGEMVPMVNRNRAYEEFFHGPGRAPAAREAPTSDGEDSSSEEDSGAAGEAGSPPSPNSIDEVISTPQFRALPPAEQIDQLAAVSPLFDQYLQQDRQGATQWAQQRIEALDPDWLSSLEGGWSSGVGMMQLAGANAAMIVEQLGLENDYDESWMKAAQLNFLDAETKIGSDWYDIALAILGGLPGGLAVPAAATAAAAYALPAAGVSAGATALLAPALGFGAGGALMAAHEGPEAALERGLTDAALGATFPLTQHLGRLAQMGVQGGLAYVISEQEDPVRRGIEAATMGIVAGAGRRRAPAAVWEKLGIKLKDKSIEGKFKAQAEALETAKRAREEVEANALPSAEGEQARPLGEVFIDDDGQPYMIDPIEEAVRVREANNQSIEASKQVFIDENGHPHVLADAQKQYAEEMRSVPPNEVSDFEKPPHQLKKIETAEADSAADMRPLGEPESAKSKSRMFAPGPKYQPNRVFEIPHDLAEPIFGGKMKKAGDIASDLLKVFDLPALPIGNTKERRANARTLGWWMPKRRDMHVLDRYDIQTIAHEWGHDVSFLDPNLSRWMTGKKFREDAARIDHIYDMEYPNAPLTHDVGAVASTASGRRYLATKAPVSAIFQLWKDGKLPEDLRYIPEFLSISYDRNLVYEGMSEAIRAWLTNNKRFGGGYDLAKELPNVHKILEGWKESLPRHKRRAVERFQKDAHEHLEMNATAGALTRYGEDADPATVLANGLMRFRQGYVDDLSGLYNYEMKTFGRILPDGPYEAARLLRGIGQAADEMVFTGYPVFFADKGKRGTDGRPVRMIKFVGEKDGGLSLAGIFKRHGINSKKKLFLALHYSTMRQAAELKSQARVRMEDGTVRTVPIAQLSHRTKHIIDVSNTSRERLFDWNQIEAGLKLSKKYPEFVQIHEELKQYASKLADFGQEAGLWSRSQRKGWMRNEFVYSFFRDMSHRAQFGKTNGGGTGKPTRTLIGSDRNLRDPLVNLIETHARTFRLALENQAKKKLVETISRVDGGGRFGMFMKRIPQIKRFKTDEIKEAYVTELNKKFQGMLPMAEVRKMVDDLFQGIKDEDLEAINLFMGMKNPYGPDVFTVFYNGKATHWKFHDPLLVRSLNAIHRPELFGIEKHWNALRKLKQRAITLAPGFIAANFVRDVAMASIMSKTGHFHLAKAVGGLWSALRKDQHYQDFIANGGGAAGISDTMGTVRNKLIRHAQRTGFNPQRLLLDSVSVHRMLDHVSSAVEVSSRLGEYKAARKQGASARHAAYLGREVSTDFGMRGDNATMNFFANTVPFFNAMVQGGDKMFRSFQLDPMRERIAVGTKVAMVAGGGAALYMLNRQIPQYMDLPDWDKWAYWHFFVPKWTKDGERVRVQDGKFAGQLEYDHFKMPKLWEVGSISSIFERLLQSMLDDPDRDTVSLAQDVGHLIAMNFGLNLFDRAFPIPLPAGLDVAVEQFSNRVLFTGNPIESQAMANLESWRKRRPEGPRVFGEYGKLMRDVPAPDVVKSPARAEAFLRGIFGEFTMIGAALADSVLFPGGPTKSIDQYPVVNRFYEGTAKYSRSEKEFYERFTSIRQANATMRKMADNPGEIADLENWLSNPENLNRAGLNDTFARQQAAIGEITKYIAAIYEGGLGFSPEEAAAEIKAMEALKVQMMSEMNAVAREIERNQK